MRKTIVSIGLIAAMSICFTACGGGENSNETTVSESSTVSETSTSAVSELDDMQTEEEKDSSIAMPVLSGITFYTLMENLTSQQSFEDYTLTSASDGYYYDAFSSDYRYYYSVHTNESSEIASAEFYIMTDNTDYSFLTYCASLPYDTSEPEKAQKWVEKNIGKEKSKSFGDATYKLSTGEKGPILTITATGYDDYLNNKTNQYLNQETSE